MLLRKYEMPWRRPIELISALVWSLAILAYIAYTPQRIPLRLGFPLLLLCAAFAVRRAWQGLAIIGIRAALSGRAMQVMTTRELARFTTDPDQVVFGFGFEWQPVHSQRLYELAKIDYRELRIPPPAWRWPCSAACSTPRSTAPGPTSTASSNRRRATSSPSDARRAAGPRPRAG